MSHRVHLTGPYLHTSQRVPPAEPYPLRSQRVHPPRPYLHTSQRVPLTEPYSLGSQRVHPTGSYPLTSQVHAAKLLLLGGEKHFHKQLSCQSTTQWPNQGSNPQFPSESKHSTPGHHTSPSARNCFI